MLIKMICPNCGFDNPSGSFCGKCGASISAGTPAAQAPMPKPKGKKTLFVAIAAIVIVVAVVLAAVLVFLPKTDQANPEAALTGYFDGAKNHDAIRIVDSTIMHFDTANRSLLISSLNSSWSNMTFNNVTITNTEAISSSSVPADIKLDVTNFTNYLQNKFQLTVQESQFLKVTMTQTNSSTDSYSATTYTLFSKIDGKWYFDIYVSYSTIEWAADRSYGDRGGFNFPGTVITTTPPTGTFLNGINSTGSWHISVLSMSSSTVNYSDCLVKLTIGTHVSSMVPISSLNMTILISAGNATGYTLTINDFGSSGYVSAGDLFTVGPFTSASGLNAKQPTGTAVTLTLYYKTTGGTASEVAETTFHV